MKKTMIFFFTILFIVGGLVGCASTGEVQQDQTQGQKSSPQEKQPTEQQPTDQSDAKDQGQKEPTHTRIDNLDSIKQNLKIGMKDEEVKKVFGEPNATDKQTQQWRYDFEKEDYHFGEKVMAVDIDGLKNGKMKAQLFVHYKDGMVVDSYYVYYLKSGEIIQQTVNLNGESEGPASAD